MSSVTVKENLQRVAKKTSEERPTSLQRPNGSSPMVVVVRRLTVATFCDSIVAMQNIHPLLVR